MNTSVKVCATCKEAKPVAEFYNCSAKKDGKHSYCKVCDRKKCSAHYEQNKERISVRAKDYYTVNKEGFRAQSLKWKREHPEIMREKQQAYRLRNLDKMAAKEAKRRFGKNSATPAWANMKKISEIYFVAKVTTKTTGIPHHVDHIVPLKSDMVCGLHVENNLRVVTRDENLRKANSFNPHSFLN